MTGRYEDCPQCGAIMVDRAKHRCPPQFECCWEWSIESPDDPDTEWHRVYAFDASVAAEMYVKRRDDGENDVVENGVTVWVRRVGATGYSTFFVSAALHVRYTARVMADDEWELPT